MNKLSLKLIHGYTRHTIISFQISWIQNRNKFIYICGLANISEKTNCN